MTDASNMQYATFLVAQRDKTCLKACDTYQEYAN